MAITFRTIIAKYPGRCSRCNQPIAVGEQIRYGGGRAYHLAAKCPGVAAAAVQDASKPAAAVQATPAPRVAQAAPQPARAAVVMQPVIVPAPIATPQPGPAEIMSATIAAQLQGTFASLMARPVILADVEPRERKAPEPEPAPKPAKAANLHDNETDPESPTYVPAMPKPTAKPAARKPATRRSRPVVSTTPAIDLQF